MVGKLKYIFKIQIVKLKLKNKNIFLFVFVANQGLKFKLGVRRSLSKVKYDFDEYIRWLLKEQKKNPLLVEIMLEVLGKVIFC